MENIDDKGLEILARMINGEEREFPRKTGDEIENYFQDLGAGEFKLEKKSRFKFCFETLKILQEQKFPVEIILKSLASPKQYEGEDEIRAAIEFINKKFKIYGYRVSIPGGIEPVVQNIPPDYNIGNNEGGTSLQAIPYPPHFEKIPPAPKNLLILRWNEAQSCLNNGDHLASIIMSGSLLEGYILCKIAANKRYIRKSEELSKGLKKKINDGDLDFQDMISVMRKMGWLDNGMAKLADHSRDFRNYVHFKKQLEEKPNVSAELASVLWGFAKNSIETINKNHREFIKTQSPSPENSGRGV